MNEPPADNQGSPNGLDTTYWLQYGTTADYKQNTASTDACVGQTLLSVAPQLIGLTAGTTYYGYYFTLTTPTPPAPAPSPSFVPPVPSMATFQPVGVATVNSKSAVVRAHVNPRGSTARVSVTYGTSALTHTSR